MTTHNWDVVAFGQGCHSSVWLCDSFCDAYFERLAQKREDFQCSEAANQKWASQRLLAQVLCAAHFLRRVRFCCNHVVEHCFQRRRHPAPHVFVQGNHSSVRAHFWIPPMFREGRYESRKDGQSSLSRLFRLKGSKNRVEVAKDQTVGKSWNNPQNCHQGFFGRVGCWRWHDHDWLVRSWVLSGMLFSDQGKDKDDEQHIWESAAVGSIAFHRWSSERSSEEWTPNATRRRTRVLGGTLTFRSSQFKPQKKCSKRWNVLTNGLFTHLCSPLTCRHYTMREGGIKSTKSCGGPVSHSDDRWYRPEVIEASSFMRHQDPLVPSLLATPGALCGCSLRTQYPTDAFTECRNCGSSKMCRTLSGISSVRSCIPLPPWRIVWARVKVACGKQDEEKIDEAFEEKER